MGDFFKAIYIPVLLNLTEDAIETLDSELNEPIWTVKQIFFSLKGRLACHSGGDLWRANLFRMSESRLIRLYWTPRFFILIRSYRNAQFISARSPGRHARHNSLPNPPRQPDCYWLVYTWRLGSTVGHTNRLKHGGQESPHNGIFRFVLWSSRGYSVIWKPALRQYSE